MFIFKVIGIINTGRMGTLMKIRTRILLLLAACFIVAISVICLALVYIVSSQTEEAIEDKSQIRFEHTEQRYDAYFSKLSRQMDTIIELEKIVLYLVMISITI